MLIISFCHIYYCISVWHLLILLPLLLLLQLAYRSLGVGKDGEKHREQQEDAQEAERDEEKDGVVSRACEAVAARVDFAELIQEHRVVIARLRDPARDLPGRVAVTGAIDRARRRSVRPRRRSVRPLDGGLRSSSKL